MTYVDIIPSVNKIFICEIWDIKNSFENLYICQFFLSFFQLIPDKT